MTRVDVLKSDSAPPVKGDGLRVEWFEAWHPVLDDALQELPEMEFCSHELFRLLMQSPSPTRKRTALVTDGGQPVAVVGLRQKKRHWEPVGQWVVPLSVAPARDDFLFPTLASLRLDVRIEGWQSPLPESITARSVTSTPAFAVDLKSDFHRYWRKSGNKATLRKARLRTKGFTFEVDAPGSAEWTIRNWAEKWRDHPYQEVLTADDQLLAAEYYQKRGQYHSLLLLDGGSPVAGATCFVYRNDLLIGETSRDEEYRWHSVGNRLNELMFDWAAESGYSKFHLGGAHDYKAHWGPRDGEEWEFHICPLSLHLEKQVRLLTRWVQYKAKALRGRASRWGARLIPGRMAGRSARTPAESEDGDLRRTTSP